MEVCPDRVTKNGYGKATIEHMLQRTFPNEHMNVQTRSIFNFEATSAELTSSQMRFAQRMVHQGNIQSSNPTLWKTWRSKHERSTRLDTDPEEMVSQQSGHNSTGRGGMPSSKGERPTTHRHIHPCKCCKSTVGKHSAQRRTRSPAQRRRFTLATLSPSQQEQTKSHAHFDNTHGRHEQPALDKNVTTRPPHKTFNMQQERSIFLFGATPFFVSQRSMPLLLILRS